MTQLAAEQQANTLWRALTHPTRRQIVALLLERSRTTGELADQFEVSRFAVMKHLKVLEEAALVRVRREGRRRWNVLNEAYRDQVARAVTGPPGAPWTAAAAPGAIEDGRLVRLPAAAADVFRALTVDIDAWYPREFGPNSHITLERHPGGRCIATFPDGGGALLGIVTHLEPDRALSLWLPSEEWRDGGVLVRLSLLPAEGGTDLRVVEPPGRDSWFHLLDEHLRPHLAETTVR